MQQVRMRRGGRQSLGIGRKRGIGFLVGEVVSLRVVEMVANGIKRQVV